LVILDEADELLRPNFKDEIDSILHMTPEDKQVMLFSATLPPDVRHVIGRHMRDPISIDLTSSSSLVPQSITHNVLKVDVFEKFNVVLKLLRYHNPPKAIVFTPTKRQARGLGDFLIDNNIRAASLHSDLSQNARERILDKFRGGELKVIAATDVAARGIDIPEINLIIQVDPPPSGIDYYIHRSGRTGRKGLVGTSMLLLSHDRASDEFLRDLKRVVKVKFIRPPTAGEVMNAGLVNAAKCISEFNDDKLIEDAMPLADELLKTDGIKALASAIVEVYSSSLKGIVDGNDGRQWMDDRQRKMNDRSYGDPMDGDRYASRSLYRGDYMERERRTKDRPFNRSINDHHRYKERSFNRSYGERRMKDRAYDGYMRSGMNDERYNHFDYKDDHDDDGRIDVGDFNEVK
jgi:superfamily II DNA/RNA helicase